MKNEISIRLGASVILLRFENSDMPKAVIDTYRRYITTHKPSSILIIKNSPYLPKRINIVKKNYTFLLPKLQSNSQSLISFANKDLCADFITPDLNLEGLSYAVYFIYLRWLQRRGRGISLHSSGIKVSSDAGCLFVGPSGSGKSTLANLNESKRLLNDDENIIEQNAKGFKILSFNDKRYWGKEMFYEELKLDKIFFLKKSNRTLIYPLRKTVGICEIVKNALGLFPWK